LADFRAVMGFVLKRFVNEVALDDEADEQGTVKQSGMSLPQCRLRI
jgi:hypothetical protein